MYLTHKAAVKRLVFSLFFLICFSASSADRAAQLLVYRVTEPGVEPYISRILVTQNYLRMDQGQDDDGFILLDRKTQTIYSVNSADKTILEIKPRVKTGSPAKGLILQANIVEDQKLPDLPGRQTEYWRFFVNEKLCRSAIVAPGMMQSATDAYAEYLVLLAVQHQSTQRTIPQELQDACDQAVHIVEPLAVLDKGLPVREWVEHGSLQELIDYRQSFNIPEDSFHLPEGYRLNSLGKLQEGF